MKFAGVICLVYFTICVNAAAKKCSCCKEVLQKLNKLECPKPGTLRHVFYLADVSNGLNLPFLVNLNLKILNNNFCTRAFYYLNIGL